MSDSDKPRLDVNSLLEACIELDQNELDDFLANSGAPEELIRRVKALLKSEIESSDFLDGSALELLSDRGKSDS